MATNKILIIEDSLSLSRTYAEYLKDEPYKITYVHNGEEALALIQRDLPQVILLDLGLPDINGMEILKTIPQQKIPAIVIVITAENSIDTAVSAMRAGAFDFIAKPFNANRLLVTLKNAIEHQRLSTIAEVFAEDFARDQFCHFMGSSLTMQSVYRIIESAAPSKATVFISGESGTGKELAAEAIHHLSPRSNLPFVTINCAAIPKDLIESEIFGHVKGAFTGASSERIGAAQRADKGSLFLDEICEMDLELQSKLLRFIQTGTFQKVGSSHLEKVDLRFICATNRDVVKRVAAGKFREDLFYRLHVIPISLPPLRERENDVITIARKLLRDYAHEEKKAFRAFAPEVEVIFRLYNWPGNVRQLQNVIRHMVVLNNNEIITRKMLPPPLDSIDIPDMPEQILKMQLDENLTTTTPNTENTVSTPLKIQPLWKIEKQVIEEAIRCCDGNIPKAAALLDISASTVYRKIQAWDEHERI